MSYRELSHKWCFNLSAFNIKHEQFQSNIVTKAEPTDVFSRLARNSDPRSNRNVIIIRKQVIKKPIFWKKIIVVVFDSQLKTHVLK